MGKIVSYNHCIQVHPETYGESTVEGILVELSDESLNKIDTFVKNVIEEKLKEPHHQIDGNQEYKRFSTGTKGERALEVLLRRNFIDWSVGDSKKYHRSDLRSLGLNVGVKSVELGKAPLIFKNSSNPEIMTVLINDKQILICGFASRDVLNNPDNQSMNHVKSPKLRERGTKTAFVGFDKLQMFNNYATLESLVKSNA